MRRLGGWKSFLTRTLGMVFLVLFIDMMQPHWDLWNREVAIVFLYIGIQLMIESES